VKKYDVIVIRHDSGIVIVARSKSCFSGYL